MVSQANESQTGDGFEEFVNSINELNINRKIKKVTIINITFLYRHCVPDFYQHLDKNVPTMWFLNNENTIKKINCDVLLESYIDQVNTGLFKEWHKKIVDDFSVVKEFKSLITQEAELFVSKGRGAFDDCLNFLLEEYAHTCAFLKNRNIIYPMPFSAPMVNLIERYNLNIIVYLMLCQIMQGNIAMKAIYVNL